MLTFGVWAFESYKNTQLSLEQYHHNRALIYKSLNNLKHHMGYGGLIHDFKNLVIRRDIPRYHMSIEKNISYLKNDLDELETLLDEPDDLAQIAVLRSVFSEYFQKYKIVISMINEGKNTTEIDSVVKVFDGSAFKAQNALMENIEKRNVIVHQKVRAIEKETLNFIKISGSILMFAVLTAIATILILLSRLTRTNTNYLHAKDELYNLLDATPDPIISVSHDGCIVRVNQMAIQFFGYSKEKLIGMKIESLIPERFRKRHENHRTHYFSDSQNRAMGEGQLELLALLSDGREINVELSLSYFGEGLDRLVMVAIRDVTAQLENRTALLSAKADKMESLSYVTAGVAHHLNNYLAAIMGYSELLKDLTLKESENNISLYMDKILGAGNKANKLIQKMLTFSKISHNTNESDTQVTSVVSVINEIIPLIRSSLPDTVDLYCHIKKDDLKVHMSHINLQNILFNLIMNSSHAISDEGVITINISEQHYNEIQCDSCNISFSGDYINISVHDNGSGISEPDINKIFDPFFTTKGLANSSGMGLSVVHGLVHLAKGHIIVESNIKSGTTFTISIP